MQGMAGGLLTNEQLRSMLLHTPPAPMSVLDFVKLIYQPIYTNLEVSHVLDPEAIRFLGASRTAAMNSIPPKHPFIYVDLTSSAFLPQWLKPSIIGGRRKTP